MKRRIRLTEGDLRRIVKGSVRRVLKEESVKRKKSPKRELEDAIDNVLGILHAYTEDAFEILSKEEFEDLYGYLNDLSTKIKESYDYGPYEGEPIFGY